MAKSGLTGNKTGFAKMPVRLTSKAPKSSAKATQARFGNSTRGRKGR